MGARRARAMEKDEWKAAGVTVERSTVEDKVTQCRRAQCAPVM